MTWLKQGEAELRAEVSLTSSFAFFTLYEDRRCRGLPKQSGLLTLRDVVELREYEFHSQLCLMLRLQKESHGCNSAARR